MTRQKILTIEKISMGVAGLITNIPMFEKVSEYLNLASPFILGIGITSTFAGTYARVEYSGSECSERES